MCDKTKNIREKLNIYLSTRDCLDDLFCDRSPCGAMKKCVSSLAQTLKTY